MQLVHSAFRTRLETTADKKQKRSIKAEALINRFLAHQQICEKYKNEIAAIQQYIPDWKPQFSCE